MEPSKQHEAAPSLEQVPSLTMGGENLSAQNHELSSENRAEKAPELGQVQAEISQIAMPSLPSPVVVDPATAITQPQADDSNPIVANDEDLIEKEWVDKAKGIIAATKDDPYRREQEINRLQIDYLRKRYGREVGNAGD